MESRKSSRKPAPTCPSKCLQVYSWNCCLAGMPRKFEETPGSRSLDDEKVRNVRTRLFGSWEMNWVAYNFAHDVQLPGSGGASVNFLMYPQAETNDGLLDSLDPDSFKYEITSREIQ